MATSSTSFTGGTVIQPELVVRGGLVGKGNVTIGGTIEGNIDTKGHCHVDRSGKVEGDVHAKTITVNGQVKGNLFAQDKVMVQETARIEGNVTAPSIYVAEGATLNGQMNIDKSNK